MLKVLTRSRNPIFGKNRIFPLRKNVKRFMCTYLFQKYRRKCYSAKCYSAFYADENDRKPLLCIDAFIAAASQHRVALQYWLNKLQSLDFLIILEKIPNSRFSETAFEFSRKILHENQYELLERGRALI